MNSHKQQGYKTIEFKSELMNTAYGFFRKNVTQLFILAVVLVLTMVFIPSFFHLGNLVTVTRQSATAGIVSIGLIFVVLTGGLDMSVGAVVAMSGIVFALLAKGGTSVAAAFIFALGSGVLVGVVNSFGVLFLGMQPFIMTIASASIISGIAHLLCGGNPVGITNVKSPLIDFLGVGNVAGIPTAFLIFVAIAILFSVILRYLPFGRYVYSVGNSLEGSRLAGIRTTRVAMIAYMICSLCAALAGVMSVCTYNAGYPAMGSAAALDAIAAVVIGGASLQGGKGSIFGTVVGVLLLSIVSNISNLMGVSTYLQQIVKGVIIVGAILLSTKGIREQFKRAWRGL